MRVTTIDFSHLFLYPKGPSKVVGHNLLATARSNVNELLELLRYNRLLESQPLCTLSFLCIQCRLCLFQYCAGGWVLFLIRSESMAVIGCVGSFLMFVGRRVGCSQRMDDLIWRCRTPSVGNHFGYEGFCTHHHASCHE